MFVGGCELYKIDTANPAKTITQLFNTQSGEWSNGPNLNTARCRAGCAVSHTSSPYLYVFGGCNQYSGPPHSFFFPVRNEKAHGTGLAA